jgi:phenylacetate-CoA ligase
MALISDRKLRTLAAQRTATLAAGTVVAEQLRALNARWAEAVATVERYRSLTAEGAAPTQFKSLEEYVSTVPVLTKAAVQTGSASRKRPRPDAVRKTGGSTAEPVQMPAYRSEAAFTRLDPWLGRGWFGITPLDRMFLFWGHAHLLGQGWRGKVNATLRVAKDFAQGYERVSCYDLSVEHLRSVGERLLRTRATFVVGYSHALDALARANHDRAPLFRKKGFKAIVAAAECLPMADSQQVIESTFGAPLGMEYGSVETNLVAHTAPDGLYHVFWNNYLLEYRPRDGDPGKSEAIVTALYPRCTPLFRYSLGDSFSVERGSRDGISVLSFSSVLGRSNQYIQLPGGGKLHSEVVSHIIRDCPEVAAFQFVCTRTALFLDIVPSGAWTGHFAGSIRDKAYRVDPRLAETLTIRVVSELRQSIAGKRPAVVQDEESFRG